jgi:hypothetical protein
MINSKESFLLIISILFIVSFSSLWMSFYLSDFEYFFFIGLLSFVMTVIYLLKSVSNGYYVQYSPVTTHDFITAIDDSQNKV